MSRITLRQLEYLRAIAATGSLLAAAEREHVSRSTIAAGLDELERSLETQLCVRHKAQGIELTESGVRVLAAAQRVLDETEDLESIARRDRLRGTLTVGCFGSIAPTILPTLISRFAEEHPEVTVVPEVAATDALSESVKAGRLDLIISYRLHLDPELETRALYSTRMHAVLPPTHDLARERVVSGRELADEPLVLLTTPPSPEDAFAYFASQGLRPRVRFRIGSFELGRSMIAAGLGYSLYMQRPRHDLTYDAAPVAIRPLDPEPTLTRVSVAWFAGRRLPAKAREFARLAVESGPEVAPRSLYDIDHR